MALTNPAVRIGTNLVYAAIHEFGGIITPKNGEFLVFEVEGFGGWTDKVFARQVEIPARPYLRTAADTKRGEAFAVAGKVMGELIETHVRVA